MEYRQLGKTGLTVSEIGYGAWGIGASAWIGAQRGRVGDGAAPRHRARRQLHRHRARLRRERADRRAASCGTTRTCSSPRRSRRRTASGRRPTGLHPDETFPGDHIRASLETSLAASGLEAFDVLQFHVWSDEWVGRGDWLETIADLRQEGKIRFFGVSINDYQPENALALVRSGAVDTVQVIYNAWHQQPEEQLLPACAEHGVGVIVRVALDEGGLTGRITADSTFPEGDFRNRYFGGDRPAQVEQHVEALVDDLGVSTDELPDLALRYVLDQPAVSTVIAGMRTVRNVERNAATSDGRRLTDAQRDVIRRHRWERNFYQAPDA